MEDAAISPGLKKLSVSSIPCRRVSSAYYTGGSPAPPPQKQIVTLDLELSESTDDASLEDTAAVSPGLKKLSVSSIPCRRVSSAYYTGGSQGSAPPPQKLIVLPDFESSESQSIDDAPMKPMRRGTVQIPENSVQDFVDSDEEDIYARFNNSKISFSSDSGPQPPQEEGLVLEEESHDSRPTDLAKALADEEKHDVLPQRPTRRITNHSTNQSVVTISEDKVHEDALPQLPIRRTTNNSAAANLTISEDKVHEDALPQLPTRRTTINSAAANLTISEDKVHEDVHFDDDSHFDGSALTDEFGFSRGLSSRALSDNRPQRPSRRSTLAAIPFHYRSTILLFGDSLTQNAYGMDGQVGWASLLSSTYQRRADVLNRGFSGYNTNHALSVMTRNFGFLASPVLFVTIFFGANDAALPGQPQHVPQHEYYDNLVAMVRRIRMTLQPTTKFPILLLTPPPVDEEAWCKSRDLDQSDRTNEMARAYGDQIKKVAANVDANCAVVDTWELLEGETEWRGKYLSDGLHLNGAGNQKVFEGIMETIQSHYLKLAPMEDGKIGVPMEEKLWTELVDSNK
jgi:lysophospholipase L1-like esterase